jgi:hypothetical protein
MGSRRHSDFEKEDAQQFCALFCSAILPDPFQSDDYGIRLAYGYWDDLRRRLQESYLLGLGWVSFDQAKDLAICALQVYRAKLQHYQNQSLAISPALVLSCEKAFALVMGLEEDDTPSLQAFERQRKIVDEFEAEWREHFKTAYKEYAARTESLFHHGPHLNDAFSPESPDTSSLSASVQGAPGSRAYTDRNLSEFRSVLAPTTNSTRRSDSTNDNDATTQGGEPSDLPAPFEKLVSDPHYSERMSPKLRKAYKDLAFNERAHEESPDAFKAERFYRVAFSRAVLHREVLQSHTVRNEVRDKSLHWEAIHSASCMLNRVMRLGDGRSFICRCQGLNESRHGGWESMTWRNKGQLYALRTDMQEFERELEQLYKTNLYPVPRSRNQKNFPDQRSPPVWSGRHPKNFVEP